MRRPLKLTLLFVLVCSSCLVESADCANQVDDSKCLTRFPPNNCTAGQRCLCLRLCNSCKSIKPPIMRTETRTHDDEAGPSSRKRPRRSRSRSPSRSHGSRGNSPGSHRFNSPSRSTHSGPQHSAGPTSPRGSQPRRAFEFFEKRVNKNLDPCDDFYEFACNRYLWDHNPQSAKEYSVTKDEQRDRFKQEQMDLIMRTKVFNSSAVETMIVYWKKCTGMKAENERSLTGLWLSVNTFGSTFPMLGHAFDKRTFGLELVLEKMADAAGLQFAYRIDVLDVGRSSFLPIVRVPNLIVRSPDFYFGDDGEANKGHLCVYIDKVIRLAAQGQKRLPANLWDQIVEVVEFDKKVATKLLVRRHQATSQKQMSKLKEMIKAFDFFNYVKMNPLFPNSITKVFHSHRMIFVEKEETLMAIDNLYAAANKRLLANYFLVRFILDQAPFFDKRFVNLHHELNHQVYGTRKPSNQEVHCYNKVMEHFGLVADHLYVKHLKETDARRYNVMKIATKKMVDRLRFLMKEMVQRQEWMKDAEIQQDAMKKLDDVHFIVGIADDALDKQKVDREYESVKLTFKDSFAKMNALLRKNRMHEVMMQLEPGHVLVPHWAISDMTALNSLGANTVYVSMALLQATFVDLQQPLAFYYGLLAPIIGRELTHGFNKEGNFTLNTRGSLYNAKKKKEYKTWWDKQTEESFQRKANSVAALYKRQLRQVTDQRLDLSRTLVEDIADASGIRIAFKTYQLQKSENEHRMFGYEELTPAQLFFVSYATFHCSTYSTDLMARIVETDRHLPDHLRINTVLGNYQEFADAFQCAKDKRMNPAEKTSVWSL